MPPLLTSTLSVKSGVFCKNVLQLMLKNSEVCGNITYISISDVSCCGYVLTALLPGSRLATQHWRNLGL